MNKLVCTSLFGIIFGLSLAQDRNVLSEFENVLNKGGYHFRYKTGNSERTENGVFDASKGESGVISVTGSYSYIGPDGKAHKVDYVADENGYRPRVKFGGESNVLQKSQEENLSLIVPYISSDVVASLTGGGLG